MIKYIPCMVKYIPYMVKYIPYMVKYIPCMVKYIPCMVKKSSLDRYKAHLGRATEQQFTRSLLKKIDTP